MNKIIILFLASSLCISSFSQTSRTRISPIPANGTINVAVTTARGPVDMLVKNLAGVTVKSIRTNSSGAALYTSIDISSLPKGT